MRKLTIPELGRTSRDQFVSAKKKPIVLVLDNIRSGLNVGSIFRTADAFALEKIILCGITPQPPHREIHKTALGATDSVAWEYAADGMSVVRELIAKNYHVLPVEQTDRSISLDAMSWEESTPYAFIFGNEVDGIRDDILEILAESIEIPQYGTKHSLNVAVSVGIVIWHVLYGRGLSMR